MKTPRRRVQSADDRENPVHSMERVEYNLFKYWWTTRRHDDPRTAITASAARQIAILVFDELYAAAAPAPPKNVLEVKTYPNTPEGQAASFVDWLDGIQPYDVFRVLNEAEFSGFLNDKGQAMVKALGPRFRLSHATKEDP